MIVDFKQRLTGDQPGRSWRLQFFIGFLLVVGVVLVAAYPARAGLSAIERISVGTGGLPSDGSSFHANMSANGRFVTFESWATNWAPDQPPTAINWVDVFVRDRWLDQTQKITFGHDGQPTDEDSLEPVITADGHYIVYNSYATNLVPNDTNDHEWLREGLDVFLFDRGTGQTQRVSLTHNGQEIKGNSVGIITPDGRYILFASNGPAVVPAFPNGEHRSGLYLRDWQTGAVSLITVGIDGKMPNSWVAVNSASYDGQYIVFISDSSNLVPNDTNGYVDIFLYNRADGTTTRVTQSYLGGETNEDSQPALITPDGRYIIYKSNASNIVPGDTNNASDIFLYEMATGMTKRVSVSNTGAQGNGESKDPAICENGRYISFTSEATNLVPGDTNNERDVFLVDVAKSRIEVVTINGNNQWGNGRGHRSSLATDCHSIAFATEASNMIADDTNGVRDLFWREIIWPADLSHSTNVVRLLTAPGEVMTYTITLRNTGMETAAVTLSNPIPAHTTYIPGSVTGGATYSAGQIMWQGEIIAGSEGVFQYAVIVDSDVTAYTTIVSDAMLVDSEETYHLTAVSILNATDVLFLPIAVGP